MPMIYKRFTEKAAEEWRQIYKGLQLLEFLIKNGSERVIDDARSHLSLLKMLRQFQFIDVNGKDQGLNVRNRAKELAELLSDVDRIRAERKKARSNRNKFGGAEGGGMGMSGGMSSGSRYGGFGSEESAGYGGYSGGVYGDGGGYGGNTSGFQDTGSTRRDRFEEYDEYDEGAATSSARRKPDASSGTTRAQPKKAEPLKPKEPEIDLLTIGDDDIPPATPPKPSASNGKKIVSNPMGNGAITADDDDFDDFQSATPATQVSSRPSIPGIPPSSSTPSMTLGTQFAAPKPVSATQGANLNDLVGFSSISPAPSNRTMTSTPTNTLSSPSPLAQPIQKPQQKQPPRPTGYQTAQPNYFTSVPVPPTASLSTSSKPSLTSGNSFSNPTSKSSSSGGDAFGSLWSTASAGAGIKKATTLGNQGPNLASMAKEKASAGIWGANAPSTSQAPQMQGQPQRQPQVQGGGQQKVGGDLDDLLG
ncbi:Epsin-3, clathrin recruitment and traffic between the Golgi and endosome [Lignoscripta atroalba]|nr:Epsin-3, clathrin recruitment and traffic between the Golgi and endosome [Lignoscripta atroalba]